MAEQFKWIDFYKEFASKLLAYKDNRPELIRKVMKVYSDIGMCLPKLEKNNIPTDIDPFTIFALFNKGISEDNRKAIIGGLISEFQIVAPVPDDFSGIPVVNNMKATFYYFEGDREEHDIDHLWDVFVAALDFADHETDDNRQRLSNAYDIVLGQQGTRWNITMALYWIRPYTFLNLDSRNRWYMSNPENMSANVVADIMAMKSAPTAEKYLELRDKCKAALESGNYSYSTFPELSYVAWITSEEDNEREKTEKKSGKLNCSFS